MRSGRMDFNRRSTQMLPSIKRRRNFATVWPIHIRGLSVTIATHWKSKHTGISRCVFETLETKSPNNIVSHQTPSESSSTRGWSLKPHFPFQTAFTTECVHGNQFIMATKQFYYKFLLLVIFWKLFSRICNDITFQSIRNTKDRSDASSTNHWRC
jgi:hypothetical protein